MKKNWKLLVALAVILIAVLFVIYSNKAETPSSTQIEIVQTGLDTPWEIAFGPSEEMYLTERPGRLRIFKENEVGTIQVMNVEENGEGGLLGMALHPDYAKNNRIYLYKTTREGGNLKNVVESYRLENNQLIDRQVIIDAIPAASNHDGGRIVFGPDNFLYVTTGDAGQSNLAQDRNSLAGKILRVTENGEPAPGNPFNNRVYSYGHRNPEGLTWDNQGNLWATEHGASANDELNKIEIGKNYGWPEIQGEQTREGMESPMISSGGETWAPAGLAFLDGSLYFGGLRGMTLYSVRLENGKIGAFTKSHTNEFGRIRSIKTKDGNIFFSTSNRDGRGFPSPDDDKIIRKNNK